MKTDMNPNRYDSLLGWLNKETMLMTCRWTGCIHLPCSRIYKAQKSLWHAGGWSMFLQHRDGFNAAGRIIRNSSQERVRHTAVKHRSAFMHTRLHQAI